MSLLIWTWWTNQITVLTVQREPGLLTSTLVPFVTCDLTKQSTRQHGDALFEKTVLAHPWLMLDASCYLYLNGSAEDQHQTTRIHSSKSNMDSRSPFPSTLLFVLLLVLPVFANASSRVSRFIFQGNTISIFVARKLLILILGNLVFHWFNFQLYIVYMGEKKHDDPSVVTASHHDALTSVFGRY